MSSEDLIAQTPGGSFIQRIYDGKFLVCNSEVLCLFARSLCLAEEQLEEMELGYRFASLTQPAFVR